MTGMKNNVNHRFDRSLHGVLAALAARTLQLSNRLRFRSRSHKKEHVPLLLFSERNLAGVEQV
jgi:hypothetical protein